jgi:hypothetical protein
MNYADSDLVFCRKEGRLVYRTRKAEGVRESFSGVKDVLAFSLREGECRKVREILGDPRRLAALLWFSGREVERVIVTWALNGVYKRTAVTHEDWPGAVWRIPEGVARVHLADMQGERVVDVDFTNLKVLEGVYFRAGRTEYAVLADRDRVRALLESLRAVSFPRNLGTWESRGAVEMIGDWTYAASTCTGNRGLKSRLSLPAMSLRRHW